MLETLARSTQEIALRPRAGCTLAVEPLEVGKVRLIAPDPDAAFAGLFDRVAPPPRRQVTWDGVAYAWMAPGEWLLTGEEAAVLGTVAKANGPLVLAVDLTAARVSFRLAGAAARDALSSASPLDTRDHVFPVDSVARTAFGATAAFVARLPNQRDGSPDFRVVVDQTMAAHAARILGEPMVQRSAMR